MAVTSRKPLTQTRDVIRVVRTLLDGRPLSEADAKLRSYRPFSLDFEPTRRHIPIYVAALKQKSITSIGEMADGWMPIFWPYDRLEDGREWIAEGAAKVGRDPSEIATAPFTTVIPIPGKGASSKAREIISFYIGGMGEYYKELLSGFGYADECDEIERLYGDKATRKMAPDAVDRRYDRSADHFRRPVLLSARDRPPAGSSAWSNRSSICPRACPGPEWPHSLQHWLERNVSS